MSSNSRLGGTPASRPLSRVVPTLIGSILVLATTSAAFYPPVLPARAASDTREALPSRPATSPAQPNSVGEIAAESLAVEAGLLEATGQDSLAAEYWKIAAMEHFHQARPDQALEISDRALAAARRHGGAGLIASVRNLIGIYLATSGRLEEAEALFVELVLIQERLGDATALGQVWSNLANVYTHLGRLPDALEASRKALDCDQRSDNARGLLANNNRIAGLLLELGRPVDALSFAAVAESIGFETEEWIGLTSVLSRKAAVLFVLGQYGRSLQALEQAEEVQDRSGGERHRLLLRARRVELLVGLRRPAEALTLLDGLSAEFDRIGESKVSAQLLCLEGNALKDLGRTAEAEAMFRRSVQRFESLRVEQQHELSKIGVFAHAGSAYSGLSLCLLEQDRIVEAWAAAEMGMARSFTETLQQQEAKGRAGSPSISQDSSSGARDQNGSGAHHTGSPDQKPTPLDIIGSTARDLAPMENHNGAIRRVQSGLREAGAVLIQYTDPSLDPLCVFLVTPDSVHARVLGPLRPLVEDARTALSLMADGADDSLGLRPLRRLSEGLLADIYAHIPPQPARLYIIPPSELSGIPFEALPLPDASLSEETLGDRFAVSYLPSAESLSLLARRSAARSGMMVFAAPEGRDLPILRSAGREARRVASRDALVLAGHEAQEDRVRTPEAAAAAVLHFASHARVSPWAPENSALLLAGEDGRLTAADVEELELSADLVTLSACRTGGGYTVLGEGTLGLSRSFLLAGARSVVTSLWDVEDRAAADFMEIFYSGLRDGLARDEALRAARLEMQARGAGHRDRFAFVLRGVGHLPVEALRGAQPLAPSAGSKDGVGPERWSRSPAMLIGAAALLAMAALGIEAFRRRRSAIHPRG